MIIVTVISLIGSVLIGGALVQLLKSAQNQQFIKILLAFSGGFLLSLAFIHFIPELYEHSTASIGLFLLLGFLIQLVLEFFSGGIEHGHVHSHRGKHMIPFGVILALGIHAKLTFLNVATIVNRASDKAHSDLSLEGIY